MRGKMFFRSCRGHKWTGGEMHVYICVLVPTPVPASVLERERCSREWENTEAEMTREEGLVESTLALPILLHEEVHPMHVPAQSPQTMAMYSGSTDEMKWEWTVDIQFPLVPLSKHYRSPSFVSQQMRLKRKVVSLMLNFYISKLSCLSNLPRNQEKWERAVKLPMGWFQLLWWWNPILCNPYPKRNDQKNNHPNTVLFLSPIYKSSNFEMTETLCSLFLISPVFVCLLATLTLRFGTLCCPLLEVEK